MSSFDFNKLVEWAKEKRISLEMNFYESDYTYEIRVISAAPKEEYYEKRAISADSFIENWNNNMRDDLK